MLKIICFLLICFNILSTQSPMNVFADTSYARAENTIYLYKTPNNNDNTNNIYCIIEKSYFVKIIESIDNYYSVFYNGINGFVKKNDVKEIINTPQTPYPNNIKIVIGNNCNLRSSPTTNSNTNNIIDTLKSGETNITFIGKIFSEEAIDFGGTTWYLVKYNNSYGYIYNKYVKSITPIIENPENASYKTYLNSDIGNPITNIPSLVMVIILFIPCIFVLIILYLPNRKNKNQKKHNNKSKL